jgi:hypothetical protein
MESAVGGGANRECGYGGAAQLPRVHRKRSDLAQLAAEAATILVPKRIVTREAHHLIAVEVRETRGSLRLDRTATHLSAIGSAYGEVGKPVHHD